MKLDDSNKIRCFKCKRWVIKLVPIKDDGTGLKVCRDCKRKILKNKDDGRKEK